MLCLHSIFKGFSWGFSFHFMYMTINSIPWPLVFHDWKPFDMLNDMTDLFPNCNYKVMGRNYSLITA